MDKKQKKMPNKPIPKQGLLDKIFPITSKPKAPSCYQMVVMEEKLKDIVTPNPLHSYNDKQLLTLFHVKLELVEAKEMPKSAFTILRPTSDTKFNAILTVRKGDATMVNSLIPDIAAFLINMAEDGRIKEKIIRPKKEKDSVYTYKRDCLARMILMPKAEIEKAIAEYDSSKPKMDEINFVTELSKKYRANSQMVIKRIKDVRRMKTGAAYADYRSAINRLDFLLTTECIKELPLINRNKKSNKNGE